MCIFGPADILLPSKVNLSQWSVVACDQYTSQRDYWERVRAHVAEEPSALHLILPEAELESDLDAKVNGIHSAMVQYLDQNLFQEFQNSYIYVERTLSDGKIRRGILGVLDLEHYHYLPDRFPEVRATEKTVVERIPPREKVRCSAMLDMSHVLLLADDEENLIFSRIGDGKALPVLYSFDLMENGGHIVGRLIDGENAKKLGLGIAAYEAYAQQKQKENQHPIVYAVGDGNHSLAAAKACYEKQRLEKGSAYDDVKRYALVELGNIHDPEQCFEPIHRIVTVDSPAELLQSLQQECGSLNGCELLWYADGENGKITIGVQGADTPVTVLQEFLDRYAEKKKIAIDYIHGEQVLIALCQQKNTVGFCLPAIEKKDFFQFIQENGYLPRKTFSMGHANEKRYYLETRRL